MANKITCDVAIVGGGLAGALLALALRRKRPDCDVRLVESARRVGGNHIWSFFSSDIAPRDRWLVAPLISYGWTSCDVAFPDHARTLKAPYYTIESERLDHVLRETLPPEALMLKRKALAASAKAVVLADGDRIEAGGVIDCRGPGDVTVLDTGWQRFLGLELRLAAPRDVPRPTLIDATVEQDAGLHYMCVLPFGASSLFVEDVVFGDSRILETAGHAERIGAYAERMGWSVARVAREERGALPVVMGGDFEEYWRSGGNRVAKGGMRAGLFHPVTGHSLPDAVRAAALVADASDLSGAALHTLLLGHARQVWKQRKFYRRLAAVLLRAEDPEARRRVLERLYRLDQATIARFSAGQNGVMDRMRILKNKPRLMAPAGPPARVDGGHGKRDRATPGRAGS